MPKYPRAVSGERLAELEASRIALLLRDSTFDNRFLRSDHTSASIDRRLAAEVVRYRGSASTLIPCLTSAYEENRCSQSRNASSSREAWGSIDTSSLPLNTRSERQI